MIPPAVDTNVQEPEGVTFGASIDILPDSMLYKIFKYLPLKDLRLGTLLVNKRWNAIASELISYMYQLQVERGAWEIEIGPVTDYSSVRSCVKNYLKEHSYVTFIGHGQFMSDRELCVILVKSGGVMDVEVGPIWSNIDAQSKGPQFIALHPGTHWTGHWHTTRPGRMSVIQMACVGKPDNGLPTNSTEYALCVFAAADENPLEIEMTTSLTRKTYSFHPQQMETSHDEACFIVPPNDLHDVRYARLQIRSLHPHTHRTVKMVWFWTWKNASWRVDRNGVTRCNDGDGGYGRHEMEEHFATDDDSHKWLHCNDIHVYPWKEESC